MLLILCLIHIDFCFSFMHVSNNLNKHSTDKGFSPEISEFIYPKTNETLRQSFREQWLKYYECLKKEYVKYGSEKMMYTIGFITLEGTSTRLECKICISPLEIYLTESIKWYFNSSSDTNVFNYFVEYTDHILVSPDMGYLIIYDIQMEHAGVYWCEIEDSIGPPYHLTVDNDTELIHMYPIHKQQMFDPILPSIIPEYNLKIYTSWAKWSACSACNVVGKRIRYGYCTISMMNDDSTQLTIANKSTSKFNQQFQFQGQITKIYKRKRKLQNGNGTSKVNISALSIILSIFKNNLPCKFKHIPSDIQDLPAIKNRSTEVMIRYCKIKCPKNLVFEVRDTKGNILESANNSAGIYSMMQQIPPPLPSIAHVTLYRKKNKKAKLVCPGNINIDIPITWQVTKKKLFPMFIQRKSAGRIFINLQMQIIFEKLQYIDTNIYSCWQRNELVGTIKLNVTSEMELELNYYIITVGVIIIITVFLKVFWRAYQGQKRYTMH